MITIKRTNSDDPEFRQLVSALDKDLTARYGALQAMYDQYNKIERIDTVVIAFDEGQPVGCGCFKPFDERSVELKRMFVQTISRGRGIAKAIIDALEKWAKEMHFESVVLETADKQPEAIQLYQRSGYRITEKYGQYVDMVGSICMKKML